jgi:hypothetical protein
MLYGSWGVGRTMAAMDWKSYSKPYCSPGKGRGEKTKTNGTGTRRAGPEAAVLCLAPPKHRRPPPPPQFLRSEPIRAIWRRSLTENPNLGNRCRYPLAHLGNLNSPSAYLLEHHARVLFGRPCPLRNKSGSRQSRTMGCYRRRRRGLARALSVG